MRLTPTPAVPHTLTCQVDIGDGRSAVIVALADGAVDVGLYVHEALAGRCADAAVYLRATQLRALVEVLVEALALCEAAEAADAEVVAEVCGSSGA